MNKAEVAMLVRAIKANYPVYDSSGENIDRLCRYLKDFPYEVAAENVRQHILTERFPPNIAEIRGRLGDQIERDRMRAETQELFAKMDRAAARAVPPPPGQREALYERLGIRR
ncbi:replicative helicase loader/inhibitor [Paenibacillus apii]|uniref:replicative helicase loader/inhibitor n=1 Tax=Paenibacillus apii TaxID=1850370 RepID=UPI0014395501|nr:replicative helicase loader/inhibitor [Paenibacillus apii]NJJ37858.1 hypothetical protein [Paenibacillus apii]